jgi:hypothetical protein
MTEKQKFFVLPDLSSRLKELAIRYRTDEPYKVNALGAMGRVFSSMVNGADEWDRRCHFSIRRYGSQFSNAVMNLHAQVEDRHLDAVKAFSYLFLVELDLSSYEELDHDLIQAKDGISGEFAGQSEWPGSIVDLGKSKLPIMVLKDVLNSKEIVNLKDISGTATSIETRFEEWDVMLSAHEKTVNDLKSTLDEQ